MKKRCKRPIAAEALEAVRVKCDFREPNVSAAAPTPLYNTFHEVWRFASILAEHQ